MRFDRLRGWYILPQTNVSSTRDRDYRSYYSPNTRALVAEWYAPEIKLLGYRF